MLHLFRKSQRVILWVILIIVIITFVIWGSGGSFLPQGSKILVGQLDGKPVYDETLNTYMRCALVYRRLLGYEPEANTDAEKLKQEAWQLMLQVSLAEKAGLVVSDEEVVKTVEGIFGSQITASKTLYMGKIAQLVGIQMLPREFEESLRKVILVEKTRQCLQNTVLIPEQDIRQQYQIDNTLIKIGYIPFFFNQFTTGQSISSNEVEEFYNTNPEQFRLPPQINIISAYLSPDPGSVAIEDEELTNYYEEIKDRFVITNPPPDSTEVVDEEIKVRYKPFADVKDTLRDSLARQRANEIANDTMTMLDFALMDSPISDPEELTEMFRAKAQELGISTLEPGWLAQEDSIPGITGSVEAVRKGFVMKPGEESGLITMPDQSLLLFLVRDKKEAEIPPLEDSYAFVAKEIKDRRAFEMARTIAKQTCNELRAASNGFLAAAQQRGLAVRFSTPISRGTGLKDINCPARMVNNMFAFSAGFPVVLPFMDGFMIAANVEIIPADLDLLNKEMEQKLRQQLSMNSISLQMNAWFMRGAQNLKIIEKSAESADQSQM